LLLQSRNGAFKAPFQFHKKSDALIFSESREKVTVEELIPDECEIIEIRNGGTRDGQRISWSLDRHPVAVKLSYIVQSRSAMSLVLTFNVRVGALPIIKDRFLGPYWETKDNISKDQWRYYPSDDGLGETWSSVVSPSETGKIWISHGGVKESTYLDGYAVYNIPSPGEKKPILENASGQLWSYYENGLQQYFPIEKRWIQYEIEEMRPDSHTFLPVAKDRVLYTVLDRIMEFNAAEQRATVIKYATETNLGEFIHMKSASDGGVWITGARGAGKLFFDPAPRLIEYLFDRDDEIHSLSCPFENDKGELFGRAHTWDRKQEVVAHFDGVSWKKRYISIHKDYEEIPPVTCSPGQINQVLMNMLKNALEFIEGEGNVWISTYLEESNILVKIRDDGKGIPSENLSKVFDPFFTTKPIGVDSTQS